MSDKETIYVGDDKHEIEVKAVTMIYPAHDLHQRIRYPDRMEIGTEETEHHISRVMNFHDHTPRMVAHVFGIKDVSSVTPVWCRQAGSGVRHAAGLIDLSLKMCQLGVPMVWIHPEAFLHPGAQANLADILIELATDPPKTIREEQEIEAERLAGEIFGE